MISSLELAKLCGVSQGTVDRAIHNRPGISKHTQKIILDYAKRYGYQPNPAVREIMNRRSNLVGAIIPSFNNIFFMDMMTLVKESIKNDDKMLLLTPVKNREDFFCALEEFAARKMHAALVVPPEEKLILPDRITRSIPILSLFSECKGQSVVNFAADEVQTGRDAVRYLANLGHRRILHLTYPRKAKGILQRSQGYRQQMTSLGLKPLVEIYRDEITFSKTLNLHHPTAIFCHNDWLALTVIQLLQQQGLKVPQDISILGIDHTPTFQMLCPDLSSLEYPLKHFAQCISQWIKSKKIPEISEHFKLVEGKTTARVHP